MYDRPGQVSVLTQLSLQFTHKMGLLLHVNTRQLWSPQFTWNVLPALRLAMMFATIAGLSQVAVYSVDVRRGKLSTIYVVLTLEK